MKVLTALGKGLALGAMIAASGCIIVDRDNGHWHNDHGYDKVSAEEARSVREISSTEMLPTVRDRHADSFAKLEPGMSVQQFRVLFQNAAFVEQRKLDGGAVGDAYSVQLQEKLRYKGERYVFTHKDEQWFYFSDGKLVKWGEPNKWP